MTRSAADTASTRPDPARPLLVDIAKAAEILAISRSTLYQLIWTDQLTPVRIGRCVRLSVAELERFVDEHLIPDDH